MDLEYAKGDQKGRGAAGQTGKTNKIVEASL
jgi:hypothetical protein